METNPDKEIKDVSFEVIEPQPTGAITPSTLGQEYGVEYGIRPEDLGNFSFYQTGNLSLIGRHTPNKHGRYPLLEPQENGNFELKSLGSIQRSQFDPISGLYY